MDPWSRERKQCRFYNTRQHIKVLRSPTVKEVHLPYSNLEFSNVFWLQHFNLSASEASGNSLRNGRLIIISRPVHSSHWQRENNDSHLQFHIPLDKEWEIDVLVTERLWKRGFLWRLSCRQPQSTRVPHIHTLKARLHVISWSLRLELRTPWIDSHPQRLLLTSVLLSTSTVFLPQQPGPGISRRKGIPKLWEMERPNQAPSLPSPGLFLPLEGSFHQEFSGKASSISFLMGISANL